MESPDAFVPIAMVILAALFLGALVVMLLLCRKQKTDGEFLTKAAPDISGECGLLPGEHLSGAERAALELGEVCAHPLFDHLLEDEAMWRCKDDVGGNGELVAHGLAVLKACHLATQCLAAVTMGSACSRSTSLRIMEAARRMGARVDDVVRALHPPVDIRLLEARAQALALALAHLAALAPCAHTLNASVTTDLDKHLLVLREAALAQEASFCVQSVMATSTTI